MNRLSEAPTSNSCLYNCLAEVKLGKFYNEFVKAGIDTCSKLSGLSMLDFSNFGVNSIVDRVRLFQLIQIIKSIVLKKNNGKMADKLEPDFYFKKSTRSSAGAKVHRSSSSCEVLKCKVNTLVLKTSDPVATSRTATSRKESTRDASRDESRDASRESTRDATRDFKQAPNDSTATENPPKVMLKKTPNLQANNNTAKNASLAKFKVKYKPFVTPKVDDSESQKEEMGQAMVQVKEIVHNKGYNYGVAGVNYNIGALLLLSIIDTCIS